MRAQGRSGCASGTVGMPKRLTRVGQMKFASDPESRRTGTWSWVPCHETCAYRASWEAEGGEWLVTPVRIPSLTDGRCLLMGRLTEGAQLLHSSSRGGCRDDVVARPWRAWCIQPAWVPSRGLLRRGMLPGHGYGIPPRGSQGPEDDGRRDGPLTGRRCGESGQ